MFQSRLEAVFTKPQVESSKSAIYSSSTGSNCDVLVANCFHVADTQHDDCVIVAVPASVARRVSIARNTTGNRHE